MFIENQFQTINFNQKVMFGKTFAMLTYSKFQILWSIIALWFMYMMNSLGFQKWSTKLSSHYKTVLKNTWRNTITLLHSLTEKLIFFRKTTYNQRNISLLTKSTSISILISRFCTRWFHKFVTAGSAQSSKYSGMFNTNPSDPSIIFARPASNKKCQTVSIINNLPIIPMDLASKKKVKILNWIRVWFSTHCIYPLFCICNWYNSQVYHIAKEGVF